MGIVNRTKDASEQYEVLSVKAAATATGISGVIGIVRYPATIKAGQMAAFGVSGAPTIEVNIQRFIVGTGATVIIFAVGTSNVPNAFGTSGVVSTGLKIAASGSSLLNVLPNDVLMFQTGAANTAVTGLALDIALQPIQDVKSFYAGVL